MFDLNKYTFFSVFANNGHANGFCPCIAYSQEKIKEIKLDDVKNCEKPIIPIISYDLKNKFEALISKNNSTYAFEDSLFIEPDIFEFADTETINSLLKPTINFTFEKKVIEAKVSKELYLKNVETLKNHIQQGDIYEVNYCIEFFVKDITIDAFELFKKYNSLSLSPMSCFIKYNDIYIICGSPERFLKRVGNKITSEPIKGTRKKTENDIEMMTELENDQKERSENIMIVDLVRNDLSRIAKKGTVNVDELCKVHTFSTIHQSISKISCEVLSEIDFEQILSAAFPMGSMTGAPKISAMHLIDTVENSKRQLYSGSVGYILPNGDFDLNVVIRTMIYDQKNKYLSFMVGSAITAGSNSEKEYEECLVKAGAMLRALNGKLE